jgi:hypothetical protein
MGSAFNSLPALHKFPFSMSELRDVQIRDVSGTCSSRQSAHTWTFVFHQDTRAAARAGRSFAALARLERIDAGMLDGGRPVWWGRKQMAGHRSPARAPFPVRRQLATAPGQGQGLQREIRFSPSR